MPRDRSESRDSRRSSESSSSSCDSCGSNSTNATSVNSDPGSRSASPACNDTTQASLLRQSLATRPADRKYNWNTWGEFEADMRDPNPHINRFRHWVKIGVTSEEQHAGLNKFDIHPDDDAQAEDCMRSIGDLGQSLVDAVNTRYAESQGTKEVREADRARTIDAFLTDHSKLNGVGTAGEFMRRMETMITSTKRRLDEVRSTTPPTARYKTMFHPSKWTSEYWVS